MEQTEEIRRVLDAAAAGDRKAERDLFALVYEDLKQLARSRRAGQGRPESVRTTDLVHESWLKLYGSSSPRWENRRHFFGAAANAMRNVLVDRARHDAAQKRDGERRAELDDDLPALALEEPITDVLSLHLALEELERQHPRPAQVVVLRFFGGLAMPEVAEALGLSLASVERDWRFGRSWLQNRMEADGP